MRKCKLTVGDRITFKAAVRWSDKPVTRVVTGIDDWGRPEVRYGGWTNFIVEWKEITGIERKPACAV